MVVISCVIFSWCLRLSFLFAPVFSFFSVKYRSEEPPQYPADDNQVPEKEQFAVGTEDPEEQVVETAHASDVSRCCCRFVCCWCRCVDVDVAVAIALVWVLFLFVVLPCCVVPG